jgi:hypothetical protein
VAAWGFPQVTKEFNILADQIRPLVQRPPVPHVSEVKPKTFKENFFHLFDRQPYAGPDFFKTKDMAIEEALTQFYGMVNVPEIFDKYLDKVNDAFEQYQLNRYKRPLDKIDKDTYKFFEADSTMFPMPKENYVGIKKSSVFAEFIIWILRQHGLGKKAAKWIGFIPAAISGQYATDYVKECRIMGLFHGDKSHMLQVAVLYFMMKDLTLSYGFNSKITFEDLLTAFIEKKDYKDRPLWEVTRDTRSNEYVGSDPHRVQSYAMLREDTLADCFIDSFCKGFSRLHAAVNQTTHRNISRDEFVKEVADLETRLFLGSVTTLFDYSIAHEKAKGRIPADINPSGYAVVEKIYQSNSKFILGQLAQSKQIDPKQEAIKRMVLTKVHPGLSMTLMYPLVHKVVDFFSPDKKQNLEEELEPVVDEKQMVTNFKISLNVYNQNRRATKKLKQVSQQHADLSVFAGEADDKCNAAVKLSELLAGQHPEFTPGELAALNRKSLGGLVNGFQPCLSDKFKEIKSSAVIELEKQSIGLSPRKISAREI